MTRPAFGTSTFPRGTARPAVAGAHASPRGTARPAVAGAHASPRGAARPAVAAPASPRGTARAAVAGAAAPASPHDGAGPRSLRADATLLTHGGHPLAIGAAVLLDGVLEGSLDVLEGRRVVAGRERASAPLLAELRARVLAAPPASPHEWIQLAAGFAPHRIACELIADGLAAPLRPRFRRDFTLSVDARAEAAARARIATDPALAGLLYAAGLPTGDPLPPATFMLPTAARAILAALRPATRIAV
jgi:hypothetical protein